MTLPLKIYGVCIKMKSREQRIHEAIVEQDKMRAQRLRQVSAQIQNEPRAVPEPVGIDVIATW